MSKTWQVIRFEVARSLKKPSFWLAALLVPILLGFYFFIAALSGYSASEAFEAGVDTSDMTLGVFDEAKYLAVKTVVNKKEEQQALKEYDSKDAGVQDVQNEKLDVFYYLPSNFEKEHKVEVFVKPKTASVFDDYTNPIRSLLSATALAEVSEANLAVITNMVDYSTTTYSSEDNHEVDMTEAVSKLAIPAIGLALFYTLIVVLGNRLTSAMVEEKENRISELILTSIKPIHLIVGKIISLMILGIIQLSVLIIPIIIAYLVAKQHNAIPFNIALNFEPLLTIEDANSFMSVIIILTVLPMFFMGSFAGHEVQPLAYFLTYFPPSAPLAIMLRGVFNTLPHWELLLGLADIMVFGLIFSHLATKIFCRNAIASSSKINFKKLLGSPRTTWKN